MNDEHIIKSSKHEAVSLASCLLNTLLAACFMSFRLNLELFAARDVMKLRVRVLRIKESIAFLAQLLDNTSHSGFPVVYKSKPDQAEVFLGTITR